MDSRKVAPLSQKIFRKVRSVVSRTAILGLFRDLESLPWQAVWKGKGVQEGLRRKPERFRSRLYP